MINFDEYFSDEELEKIKDKGIDLTKISTLEEAYRINFGIKDDKKNTKKIFIDDEKGELSRINLNDVKNDNDLIKKIEIFFQGFQSNPSISEEHKLRQRILSSRILKKIEENDFKKIIDEIKNYKLSK